MNNQKQMTAEQVEVESLSSEVRDKSLIIARMNAQIYKLANANKELADENEKLEKQAKPSKAPAKGKAK